ncbi:MAG: SLC13 family permease, partial [Ligilactobacillus ruminis]
MKHHESSIEIGAISNKSKLIPLILGPLVALLFYFILPEQYITSAGGSETFSHAARACAAIVLWMAIWWFTEAVPIAVTSLLPIVLFPLFGVMGSSDTLKEYANGTIFLFLGGFLIAAGIARWHLDRRIALLTIRIVGTKPQQIILGLLLSTSFISAWVSNTATAAMMVPIALAVLKVVRSTREDLPIDRAEHNFGVCVLLAVAYGASLGGVLTLIGTPPNGIFARFVEQTYNVPVSFIDWMLIAFPIVVVMIAATQLLMTKVLFRELVSELPGGKDWVMHEYSKLGPMSRGEKIVLTVFVTAALLWCFGPVIRGIQIGDMTPFKALSDTVIAMGAGIILFIIPVDYKRGVHALDW